MTSLRLSLIVLCASQVLSCDDSCTESDERGSGQEGDTCVTIRDCVEGLTCMGTDFCSDAQCTSPTLLPEESDPGCLTHPDEWEGHDSHGVEPSGPDDQGCEQLIFVSGCNCVESTSGDNCLPVQPLYRRETWRRCDGCCWRLASFWQDETYCEQPCE